MAEERATFGGGCFWCVEAFYQDLQGVQEVVSGYAGGSVPNPTYRDVCDGTTGHAEVVQIRFDPETVSYRDLLDVFWRTHDPTTLNRQGADVGTQYRSEIFLSRRATAGGSGTVPGKDGCLGAVAGPDRDGGFAARRILQGRGLSSELLSFQSRPAVLHIRDRPEDAVVQGRVSGSVEGRVMAWKVGDTDSGWW